MSLIILLLTVSTSASSPNFPTSMETYEIFKPSKTINKPIKESNRLIALASVSFRPRGENSNPGATGESEKMKTFPFRKNDFDGKQDYFNSLQKNNYRAHSLLNYWTSLPTSRGLECFGPGI